MENRDLENRISSAMCEMVPENSFDKISEKIAAGDVPERGSVKMKNNGDKIRRILFPVAAACIFVVVAVLFGFTYYGNNYAVESVIDIDVNPSIEISVNKKGKVLDVVAVNADAEAIIKDMDLKKKDIKAALNDLIDSLVKKGYVVDEESGILVTVQHKNIKKAERIRSEVVTKIDESLGKHNIEAPVMNQTLTDSSEAKKFAEKNDISVGKAMFIKKLAEKDETLVPEDLAGMSIKDIMKEIEKKEIDVRDVVDCDRHGKHHDKDEVSDKISSDKEEKPEDGTDDSDVKPQPDDNGNHADKNDKENDSADEDKINMSKVKISEEDAKAKAAQAAGVNADDVVFTEVKLEREKNTIVYEIKFTVGETEYEYKVNAVDGSIVEEAKENEKPVDKNESKPEDNKAPAHKNPDSQAEENHDKNTETPKESVDKNESVAEEPAPADEAA